MPVSRPCARVTRAQHRRLSGMFADERQEREIQEDSL
jgi:hypothetical protein